MFSQKVAVNLDNSQLLSDIDEISPKLEQSIPLRSFLNRGANIVEILNNTTGLEALKGHALGFLDENEICTFLMWRSVLIDFKDNIADVNFNKDNSLLIEFIPGTDLQTVAYNKDPKGAVFSILRGKDDEGIEIPFLKETAQALVFKMESWLEMSRSLKQHGVRLELIPSLGLIEQGELLKYMKDNRRPVGFFVDGVHDGEEFSIHGESRYLSIAWMHDIAHAKSATENIAPDRKALLLMADLFLPYKEIGIEEICAREDFKTVCSSIQNLIGKELPFESMNKEKFVEMLEEMVDNNREDRSYQSGVDNLLKNNLFGYSGWNISPYALILIADLNNRRQEYIDAGFDPDKSAIKITSIDLKAALAALPASL